MEKLTKTKKEDILIREYNKNLESKVMKEFEIALQEKLDPNEMSAQEILKRDANGKPLSYQTINRKRYLEILREELERVELRLQTIKELETK